MPPAPTADNKGGARVVFQYQPRCVDGDDAGGAEYRWEPQAGDGVSLDEHVHGTIEVEPEDSGPAFG